jgi:fimbrial chaperone protein
MRQVLLPTLAAALAIHIGAACAASLQISPVFIHLDATESGKAVELRNDGDQPINAQVRIYGWDQVDEKDAITPTRELIASPPIAQIAVGEKQVVRVIRADHTAPATERSYRLLIDELPASGNDSANAVQFRFRYSVPLFISASGEEGEPDLHYAVVEKEGKPFLRVNNTGKVHAQLSAVTLKTGDGTVPLATGLLGYVLPGRTRSWPLANIASHLTGKVSGVSALVNGKPKEANVD